MYTWLVQYLNAAGYKISHIYYSSEIYLNAAGNDERISS
jgi:hypothetical protein